MSDQGWRFLCRQRDGRYVFVRGEPTVDSPCPEVCIIPFQWFWFGVVSPHKDYRPEHYPQG